MGGRGDGAKLANCGSGEKEKLGEKGRLKAEELLSGTLRDAVATGGVRGGAGGCAGLVSVDSEIRGSGNTVMGANGGLMIVCG